MPKEVPIIFHTASNCDYNFITKQLAEECTCLEESTEKYMTFTVSIGKEVTKVSKNVEEITKNISYILQFIDSAKHTAS